MVRELPQGPGTRGWERSPSSLCMAPSSLLAPANHRPWEQALAATLAETQTGQGWVLPERLSAASGARDMEWRAPGITDVNWRLRPPLHSSYLQTSWTLETTTKKKLGDLWRKPRACCSSLPSYLGSTGENAAGCCIQVANVVLSMEVAWHLR